MNTNDSKFKIKKSKFLGLSILFIIVLFTHCPVVKFNNPTEVGSLIMQLLGTFMNANQTTNTFAMRDVVTSIDEGTSKTIFVRLAVKSNTTQTITIKTDIPALEVNPTTLTFTPDNSTVEQSFTVSALIDSNQVDEIGNITISSSSEVEAKTIGITNKDLAGSWISIMTDNSFVEEGNKGSIKVKLTFKPVDTIKIDLTSDYTELTVDTAQLIFTKDNWSTEQIVGVTGLIDTNTISENVKITGSTSGITNFLTLTYRENSIVIPSTVSIYNGEHITAKLSYQPGANVTIAVNVSLTLNGTTSASSLNFTSSNYSTTQNIVQINSITNLLLDTNLYSNNQILTITASSNGMATVSKTVYLDIDKTYTTTTNANYTGGTASDETITDTVNNLIWQKCNMGQTGTGCSGSRTSANWANSISYCDTLSLGGNSNWRLPTKSELQTLVYGSSAPETHTIFASNTFAGYYWSSSTYAISPTAAWSVYFGDGAVVGYDKIGNGYVRCVSIP